MKVDQKLLETEFKIAICRQSGTLFLASFDPDSSIVKSVFDCRLPGVNLLQLPWNISKHKIGSLFLSSRCMTNYMKICSFLHAHFFWKNKSGWEFVGEKLIYWKDICNLNVYLQHNMLLKIRNFPSIMSIVFISFKHPKLPIPVTLLQSVYICMTAISPNSSSWTTSLLTC